MDNGATRSSLSSSFSAWSPDFGPADNNEHIPLPSILQQQQSSTLNEPLLRPTLHPTTTKQKQKQTQRTIQGTSYSTSYSTSDDLCNNDDDDDDDSSIGGGERTSPSSHAFVTPSFHHHQHHHHHHHHHLSSSSTLVHRAHTLDESVRYRLLAQIVGDGLHTRQFAIGLKNERALWWYEYSHSAVSRGIYSLAMVLFLLLVFIEAPSSNSFVTRNAYVRQDITVPIEILLTSVIWTDIYAQVRYQDTEWRQQLCRATWLRGRVFVASMISIDLLCTVWTPGIVRFSRPFRVWLLLSRMRNLRNAVSMAVRK